MRCQSISISLYRLPDNLPSLLNADALSVVVDAIPDLPHAPSLSTEPNLLPLFQRDTRQKEAGADHPNWKMMLPSELEMVMFVPLVVLMVGSLALGSTVRAASVPFTDSAFVGAFVPMPTLRERSL